MPGQGWSDGDLTALTGGSTVVAGNPQPYVRSDGTDAVVYQASDGIHETSLASAPGSSWSDSNLSAIAHAPAAAQGAPGAILEAILYVRSDGLNTVVYLTKVVGPAPSFQTTYDVVELALLENWISDDLTALSGAPGSSDVSGIAAYVRHDGVDAVVYRTSDGDVHELEMPLGGGWGSTDITSTVGSL